MIFHKFRDAETARLNLFSINISHNDNNADLVSDAVQLLENASHVIFSAMTSRLSLAAKLYAIFALFGLMTAAVTALSDYNSRQTAELARVVETSNLAALNVERINALIYAVVMESRGVYMSSE